MCLVTNLLPQILIILVSIINRSYIEITRKVLIVLERFEGLLPQFRQFYPIALPLLAYPNSVQFITIHNTSALSNHKLQKLLRKPNTRKFHIMKFCLN